MPSASHSQHGDDLTRDGAWTWRGGFVSPSSPTSYSENVTESLSAAISLSRSTSLVDVEEAVEAASSSSSDSVAREEPEGAEDVLAEARRCAAFFSS
jgi:hypothetical protein